jgi:TonB-linked SusC/RagA family outer membrane protein
MNFNFKSMKKRKTGFNFWLLWLVLVTVISSLNAFGTQTDGQQQRSVSGKVTDSGGQILPGVTIVVKGTTQGTITNDDGFYSLTNIPDGSTLQFSFIGMRTQEINIGKQTTINVEMEVDAIGIEEVVAVGYGTLRRGEVTGAVATVSSEKLNISPVASANNLLVGQVPGLVSRQTSGEPGKDAASLNIRGFGGALIIVDGIERSFNDIDPNSIESITVLKDAAAAVYGARAGNGVILVTTKRGVEGEPQFQLNSSLAYQGFTDWPKTLSAGQYTQLWLETQKGDGVPEQNWTFTEEEVQKYHDGTDPRYPNTNWFDVLVRKWSPQQQHNLSMRGGTKEIKYYAMFGTLSQEGFVKTGDHQYNRYNLLSNVDAKLSDNLSASINISIINSNLVAPIRSYTGGGDARNIMFQDLIVVQPMYPAYYPDRTKIPDVNLAFNPIAFSSIDIGGYRKRRLTESSMSGSLDYNIPFIEGLKANAFVNYLQIDIKNKTWTKQQTTYRYDWDNDVYTPVIKAQTALNQGTNANYTLTGQFSLHYRNSFAKHNISALALYEIIDQYGEGISGGRRNYLTSSIDYLYAGGQENQTISGNANEFGRIGYVGRVNYNYDHKYLLQLTARYDASPKFAPDNRWGFFPSVSAGWRISEESFLRDNSTIDNLRLRLSHSKSGFDATGNFQYLSGYELGQGVIFGNSVIPALFTTGLANPDIFWEEMTQTNAGIDFAFFGERFFGELDAFYRLREGMLATRVGSLPNTFGASLPAENLNSQSNRGFELMLGTRGRARSFRYNVEGNISWQRAYWEHFEEPEYTDHDDIRIRMQTGQKVGRQFGWLSDGLFTSQEEIDAHPLNQDNRGNVTIKPGDVKYVDISGPDGVPDGRLDWRDWVELGGSETPEIFFGLTSLLEYKNFDLKFLLQGATRSTIRIQPERYVRPNVAAANIIDQRWTPENNRADARFPRTTFAPANNNKFSDFWAIDGTYIRLKMATFGYSLPAALLNQYGINAVRLSISGTNLFTIAPEAKKLGIDPESPSGGATLYYTSQRTFSFNLSLSF